MKRKKIKVKYLPEPGADKSEYEWTRKKCFDFEVPYEFIFGERYNQLIQLKNGLNLEYKFKYSCSRCGQDLIHFASGKWTKKPMCADVLLRCACGEWEGEGSSFSGNWYGSELTYKPFTKDQIQKMKENEIKVIEDKYSKCSY